MKIKEIIVDKVPEACKWCPFVETYIFREKYRCLAIAENNFIDEEDVYIKRRSDCPLKEGREGE